jgi:hypothetical protein
MRQLFFALFLSFGVNEIALSSQIQMKMPQSFVEPLKQELKPFFTPSKGQIEDLLKGAVISEGKVHSPTEKEQQMMLFVGGIHPRNCTRAMRKLSLYENYHTYMDFIKESHYNDSTERFSFVVDHALLPFPMIVKFKIPRITKQGQYTFVFEDGFLKNLKGTVLVKEMGKYCLLSLKSDWKGPETKIPNLIFSTFIETVGKLGLEHLIRVSLF